MRHIDISNAGPNHVVIRHGGLRHGRADNFNGFNLAITAARDGYFDVTVARTANLVAHVRGKLAMHRNSVNGIDAVTITKSTARRRRMIKGRGDIGFDWFAYR